MPFNVSKSRRYSSVSPLRFAAPVGTPRKNIVLDVTDTKAFVSPTDGARFFVPAGTILVRSSTNITESGDEKVTALYGDKSVGDTGGSVVGVLIENVDIVAGATDGEPFGAFYRMVSFDNSKLKVAGGVAATDADIAIAAAGLPTCEFLPHNPAAGKSLTSP